MIKSLICLVAALSLPSCKTSGKLTNLTKESGTYSLQDERTGNWSFPAQTFINSFGSNSPIKVWKYEYDGISGIQRVYAYQSIAALEKKTIEFTVSRNKSTRQFSFVPYNTKNWGKEVFSDFIDLEAELKNIYSNIDNIDTNGVTSNDMVNQIQQIIRGSELNTPQYIGVLLYKMADLDFATFANQHPDYLTNSNLWFQDTRSCEEIFNGLDDSQIKSLAWTGCLTGLTAATVTATFVIVGGGIATLAAVTALPVEAPLLTLGAIAIGSTATVGLGVTSGINVYDFLNDSLDSSVLGAATRQCTNLYIPVVDYGRIKSNPGGTIIDLRVARQAFINGCNNSRLALQLRNSSTP